MGSFCASKPAVTTTNQTQAYAANPEIAEAGTQALDMAKGAAGQPFQMPAAPVAGFNPFQQQAFQQYSNIQGGLQPYMNQAAGQITEGQAPVSQEDIASYMNPYAGQALDNMKKYVFDPQRRNTMGSAVQAAGGVGAERLALTSQNLDKTQSDALSGAQAGFYSNAMQQAQRSKEMALASAQGWSNLGMTNQTGQLQATGALAGAGAQQQALSQAQAMSPYQQRLAEIAYPYQNAQFLAGITGGLAPAFGGTTQGNSTQTQQAAQPSMFSQIAGLGIAGAGLMMGNPFAAMGAAGGVGGLMSQPNNGTGFYTGNPAVPGFGNRGGSVDAFADGGEVNPWDMGQGFDMGGSPNEVVEDRFANPYLGSDQYQNIPDHTSALKNYGLSQIPQQDAPSPFSGMNLEGGSGFANPQGKPPGASSYDMLDDPGVGGRNVPRITITPRPQPPQQPEVPMPLPRPRLEPPVAPGPQFAPRPTQDPSISGNVSQDGLFMPKAQQPYPDALDRDWGQKMTRSPGMALIQAGAKMMQSTKSGIGGLGEGIEAGAATLDKQRSALRSEQQINQKAEDLYRHAKAELDKYSKVTPYQQALIDQGKFLNTGMTTDKGHPIVFDQKRGLSIDSITGEPVDPSEQLKGKAGGKGPSVFELKREAYLKLNPGDESGALNYANGKTMMSHGQLANLAAMRAQQDAAANQLLFDEASRKTFVEKRTNEWLEFYKKHNQMTSPGSAGATPGP